MLMQQICLDLNQSILIFICLNFSSVFPIKFKNIQFYCFYLIILTFIVFNVYFINNYVLQSAPPDPAMDSTEFDLQKKLLIKQQELLELQQKKLKLELLQAQVKLSEEKMKNKKPNEPEPKVI